MTMPHYRIPTHLNFPFGYRITVTQLSDSEYDEENGSDSLACWVVEERTIYLRKRRPLKKRRADLTHEVIHAVADWQAHILGGSQAEVRG